MLPHLPFLMSANKHLALRHGAAEQHVPRSFILSKVRVRMIVLHPAFQQPPRAGQAASLVTDCRQQDALPRGSIPDMFIRAALDRMGPLRRFKRNLVDPSSCHFCFDALAGSLWVIEAAVLAIRRLTRFAAAEVSGWDRLSIALMSQQLDKPRFVLDLFV